MINKVHKNWESLKVDDICEISTKRVIPQDIDVELNCIELEHIESKTGRLLGSVSTKEVRSIKNYFKPNSVLYGKLRPYLRKYVYTTNSGICSTEIWVINSKENIDSLYLYYLIQTDWWNYITNVSTGSSMPRADWKYVSKQKIEIPPLFEQQKIASILSTWDEAIERYKLLLEEKKKFKHGVVQQVLMSEASKCWQRKQVREIFDLITRGHVLAKKNVVDKPIEDNIYPVYSSQTLNEGLMGYYDKYLFEDALTWTTDGANAGTVNYRKNKFYCTNVCGVLMSKKGYANPFMAEILNSVTHRYVSYVGNPKLMNNVMEEILIPFPPLEVQNQMSRLLAMMQMEINLIENLIDQLQEQKRGLMQLLLTGKVRV